MTATQQSPAWLLVDLATNASSFSFTAAVAAVGSAVHLRPTLSLAFPASEVLAAHHINGMWQLTLGLPGLYGANSPLPTSYTEDLLAAEDDPLRRGLYDLLHQRLFRLLADVLDQHREPARQARLLGLFSGLSGRRFGGRIAGEDLLAWSGLLTGRCHGADALERLLSGWSGTPCAVEECIALWTSLPEGQLTRLGAANSTLGSDCVAGGWVLSRATAFRVTVGPVAGDVVDAWLPGGRLLEDLIALTDLLNGDALDVEVVLVVDTAGMSCPALGQARLGRDLRTTGTTAPYRRDLVYRTTGNR